MGNTKQLEPIRSALYKIAEYDKIDFEDKKVLNFQTEVLASLCDRVYSGEEPRDLINLTFSGRLICQKCSRKESFSRELKLSLKPVWKFIWDISKVKITSQGIEFEREVK